MFFSKQINLEGHFQLTAMLFKLLCISTYAQTLLMRGKSGNHSLDQMLELHN